jgi:hypothetical protein
MSPARLAARAASVAALAATLLLVHRAQAWAPAEPEDAAGAEGTDEDTAGVADGTTGGEEGGLEDAEPPGDESEGGRDGTTGPETTGEVEEATEGIEEIEEVTVVEENAAVDAKSRYHGTESPRTERGVNVALARPTRPKSLLLIIDHPSIRDGGFSTRPTTTSTRRCGPV